MAKPRILHFFTPFDNVSPFDVNMAADAGYDIIVPYTGVKPDGVTALVQDAIFSRPPKMYNNTGVFLGGWDVNQAADMFSKASKAMVPPFELSVFADPNGAYTTSAALVALIEHHLNKRTGSGFAGRKVAVFGGGPVGLCAAVLVARQGGTPMLARLTHRKQDDAVTRFAERYGVEIGSAEAQTPEAKLEVLKSVDVVIAAAKAGVQIIDQAMLDKAGELQVVADVNAVPPAGIEGVGNQDNGSELTTAGGKVAAIGALAVGKIKYDVQHGLFKRMLESGKPEQLDFPDAFQFATEQL